MGVEFIELRKIRGRSVIDYVIRRSLTQGNKTRESKDQLQEGRSNVETRYIFSSSFTFQVGPERKEITVHSGPLSSLSPTLQTFLTGEMIEAKLRRVDWSDVDEDTFIQLCDTLIIETIHRLHRKRELMIRSRSQMTARDCLRQIKRRNGRVLGFVRHLHGGMG